METFGSIELPGVILQAEGAHKDAAKHLERALGGFRSHAGKPGLLDVSHTLKHLGEVYVSQASTDKAKECFEESIRGHRKFLGAEHPQIKNAERNLLTVSGVEKR